MTEERHSTLSLLPGIVDRPQRTLAQVALYPRGRWWAPTAFLLASLAALAVVSAPLASQEVTKELQAQLAALPLEQAQIVQGQLQFFSAPAFVAGVAIATRTLGLLVSWLIAAVILYFSSLVAGGELDFGRAFAIMPWVWLPYGLRDLVQALYVLLEGKAIVYQGLSFLVATGDRLKDAQALPSLLLSQVDLFSLWHCVLVYAGLRAVARLSGGGAFFLTVTYAALMAILGALPGLLGGGLVAGGL